jgi:hypothetical protein
VSLELYNHDGTWFKVTSKDVNVETVATPDVMSLTVTEEMAKMDSGSIQLLDRNNVYSRILRPGVKLLVSWGTRLGQPTASQRNPIEVMVNSPSGGGDGGGRITFNCSFMALQSRGSDQVRWYETGTKADVISDALTRAGVLIANQEINFARGSESITAGTKIMQNESDFRFLVRMADEWRAAFRIGRDQKGNQIACFVDYAGLKTSNFVQRMTGETSSRLEYGNGYQSTLSGQANVLEYTWQDHSMDAANGQGVRIYEADGKIQMMTYNVENETVTTWRLVPERIEQELKQRDLSGQTKLMSDYLSAKTFDQIKRFFVEDTTTTAPQGSGLTIDAKLMGDPNVTAAMIATFGTGFPDRIGAADRTWWIRKVDHALSTAGYFSSVSISDAYAFSPTGEKL